MFALTGLDLSIVTWWGISQTNDTTPTEDDTEVWYMDQNVNSTSKIIEVASNTVTLTRVQTTAAGTLIDGTWMVMILGY